MKEEDQHQVAHASNTKSATEEKTQREQAKRELSPSPQVLMSTTTASKETSVVRKPVHETRRGKHKREPRRLSRSEIITIDKSTTSFNDDSSRYESNFHR